MSTAMKKLRHRDRERKQMNARGRTGEGNRKGDRERKKESFRDLRCLKNINNDDVDDDDDD